MVVNKRSKGSRGRGSWTHGWGEKKKHRGAGSRGGKGMAGSGKRGDSKKPSVWKDRKYLSKQGFTSKSRTIPSKITNVGKLDQKLKVLAELKVIEEKNGVYEVDASKVGFTKILGAGKINSKINLTIDTASKTAIEKIEKAGGKVILPSLDEVKKEAPAEKKVEEKPAQEPKEEAEAEPVAEKE